MTEKLTEDQMKRFVKSAMRDGAGGIDLDAAKRGLVERLGDEGLIDVAYARADSPFGELLLARTDKGVIRIGLPNLPADQLLEQLAERISPRVLEAPARLDDVRRELDEYFEGKRTEFDLPLDWRLARGFQGKAIKQIAKIPYGKTVSYKELATRAGNPRAVRAAGTACGANPLPVVVPCHRVLRTGGALGNYGGGPEMKKALLELEGVL
jgi:methylated-DNA-[protein]-cysteine S-methyltransferase